MNIKKIYFDMDCVLADFKKGVNELCGIPVPEQGKATDAEDDKMWDAIKAVDHFYDRLDPMPGAVEMFQELSSRYECAILSAPPKPKRGILTAKDDKISWVRRILSDTMEINIVPKEEKQLKAEGPEYVLIDDMPKNIEAWGKAGGTGIRFESPEQVLAKIRELEK